MADVTAGEGEEAYPLASLEAELCVMELLFRPGRERVPPRR